MYDVRPDKKGPRNIGVVLIIGGIILLLYSISNFSLHSSGMTEEEAQTLLKNSNRQSNENTTLDQYREFESLSQNEGSFLYKAVGLFIAGISSIIGGILLRQLNSNGPYIAIGGVGLGGCAVFFSSIQLYQSSQQFLNDSLQLTYMSALYLWTVSLGLCFALSALPAINFRSRLAMNPSVKVHSGDEES